MAIKRNNPLNIRYSEKNNWLGQIGKENGFCVFDTEDYGWRAAYLILRNYRRRGIRSVNEIIRTWAPPLENDTANYIKFVIRKLAERGYAEDLDDNGVLTLDMSNRMAVCELMSVMCLMESGVVVRTFDIAVIIDNFFGVKKGDEPLYIVHPI